MAVMSRQTGSFGTRLNGTIGAVEKAPNSLDSRDFLVPASSSGVRNPPLFRGRITLFRQPPALYLILSNHLLETCDIYIHPTLIIISLP